MKITHLIPAFLVAALLGTTAPLHAAEQPIREAIRNNETYPVVLAKAKALIQSGYTAGDGYGEVWIRDFATFIELAMQVNAHADIREQLLLFFHFQGDDGNIIDGTIPRDNATGGYDYIFSDTAPEYAGHKNTVETDQETSLIHAIHIYITHSGDVAFLDHEINGATVWQRLHMAIKFLKTHRWAEDYGLLWGDTTVDWGDVQPLHEWGVVLDDNSHLAIDIYDNAMLLLALQDMIELSEMRGESPDDLKAFHDEIKASIRTHLWDDEAGKFIPHIYLDGSPFPDDFDESRIYYFGGTAVAILAGVLEPDEVTHSYQEMKRRVERAGAATIGLTVEPPYPEGFFQNRSMGPGSYQNGGDWTWFGGRMIHALIQHHMLQEAITELQPMLDRVIENDGFYEWYTVDNEPRGSGMFRGSAGVLGKAIQELQQVAGP